MVRRLREQLSFANVTALLALFIALGGTAYAVSLPRNSVGAAQIRTGAVGAGEIRSKAVRSSEVRDRSLAVRDLSLAARESLRGKTGPGGPAGPMGPSGVTYRAAISALGTIVRGNATSSEPGGVGGAVVGFDRSVDDCVSTATLATVEGGNPTTPPAGRLTVARDRGRVLVKTYDAAGAATSLPFHLIVAC